MGANVRKIAVVGSLDLEVTEALREMGFRAEAVSGSSVLGLARTLRELQPHAVHARAAHLRVALVARLRGVPAVLEVHEEDLTITTAHATRAVERALCGSAAVRETLVEMGAPPSRVVVLRGLTRPAGSAGEALPGMLDPALRWVVCATPATGPDRGVPDALLAFGALARTRPTMRLVLNAAGEAARSLLALADAAGLRGRVIAQPLSLSQIHGAFARAAAVVAPSRSGTNPDYVPEAHFAGAAIVATAVGQHPTWIREGRTGLLVSPRAPAALSARLGALLDDAALAERLREGARRSAVDAASPRARALELSRCYAGVSRPAPRTGPFFSIPARVRI
jgi:hypothetical protein